MPTIVAPVRSRQRVAEVADLLVRLGAGRGEGRTFSQLVDRLCEMLDVPQPPLIDGLLRAQLINGVWRPIPWDGRDVQVKAPGWIER